MQRFSLLLFLLLANPLQASNWQLGPCGRGALCAGGATPLPTPTVTMTPDPNAPTPTPWPTFAATATPVSGAFALRVDVGADQDRVDGQGLSWSADRAYTGPGYGRLDTAPSYRAQAGVDLAADPGLYQSFRQGPTLSYRVDVSNGSYEVVLHFAEFVATQSGQRVQQVSLQTEPVSGTTDIYALAQNARALRVAYPVTVTNGRLDLQLQGVVGKAALAAFEVHAQAAPTATPTPVTEPLSLQLLEPAGALLVPDP